MSWLNIKRVSRRNSRRLNRLIPINDRKVKLKRKSDHESRSEKSRIKSEKKKNDERQIFLFFFSFFRHGKRGATNLGRRDRRRATAAASAARADRGRADGLGRLGAALFKGCPRAVSRSGTARSRFVFIIIPLRRKIERNTKRTPKIPK